MILIVGAEIILFIAVFNIALTIYIFEDFYNVVNSRGEDKV